MSRLRLTLACGDYDRTRALEDGSVRVDGVDLNYLRLPVEETFFRMLRHGEFEVAELSLSSYVHSLHGDDPQFVALPVYTSRMFRHGGIYVNADAGINEPSDLRGKVVGMPEYQLTAHVWIRGMLADEHDVPVGSVRYRTGGQEQAGRIEKAPLQLPQHIMVESIDPARTLSEMLVTGEIDALYSPRIPSPFAAGDPRVRRLFPDVELVEREYYQRTRIHPIMHVVVLRRDVHEAHPWLAASLTKAFTEAKDRALRSMYDTSALRCSLPWMIPQLEAARALLGEDFWPYGLTPQDERALETFLRYHQEQGLSPYRLEPRALFAAGSLEAYRI